jgi:hypothetical protein
MDETSKIRRLIWESMLSADLNCRYFSQLVGRFQGGDRWSKIFVAATSSTVVSGWAIWGRPGLDWIWQGASGLAALVALALPIWDPANSMKVAAKLAGAWFSILKDYELLWTRVDELTEAQARELCERIQAEEKRVADLEPLLRENRRLARQCEEAVRRSRASAEG